jgi:hypothetical protein
MNANTKKIAAALSANKSATGGALSTNGTTVYSYAMLIAVKKGDTLYVTTEKRSVTTSKHTNGIAREWPAACVKRVDGAELAKLAAE